MGGRLTSGRDDAVSPRTRASPDARDEPLSGPREPGIAFNPHQRAVLSSKSSHTTQAAHSDVRGGGIQADQPASPSFACTNAIAQIAAIRLAGIISARFYFRAGSRAFYRATLLRPIPFAR